MVKPAGGNDCSSMKTVASVMDKKKEIDGGCLNDDCSEMEKPLSEQVGGVHISAAKTRKPTGEKQINWVNKYQPKAFENFICHKEKAEMLRTLVRSGGSSHYIIEGPAGIGKRTMALALLREFFGSDITEAREEFKVFHLKNDSDEGPLSHIHIKVKMSPQHIEVNLADLKGYAADTIMELFKETDTGFMHQENLHANNHRAIVLYSAEKLTKDAQLHILSLLETCSGLYKVIFCCCDVSKLQHVRSLCTVTQLPPPSNKEIVEVLNFIAKQEDIKLPQKLAEDIAEMSSCCLQQAIRSFEATWQSNYPFQDGQLIMTGWEEELATMAKSIIEEQTPRRLFTIRQKLIILFQHKVSPDFIFRTLVEELREHLDDRIKLHLEILNNDYIGDKVVGSFESDGYTNKLQKSLRNNVQHFLRIEEFVAKFMSYYRWYRGSLNA